MVILYIRCSVACVCPCVHGHTGTHIRIISRYIRIAKRFTLLYEFVRPYMARGERAHIRLQVDPVCVQSFTYLLNISVRKIEKSKNNHILAYIAPFPQAAASAAALAAARIIFSRQLSLNALPAWVASTRKQTFRVYITLNSLPFSFPVYFARYHSCLKRILYFFIQVLLIMNVYREFLIQFHLDVRLKVV